MLSVGLTGGIGSGKSTVCRFFEFLDIPVYYADSRAKELMHNDPELAAAIRLNFSDEAYLPDGALNRAYLARSVFHDADRLKLLNGLVHPAVWKDSAAWMQSHSDQPYILYEAAILFETGSYRMFDRTILVYAPEELRIKRVMERDNASREEVMLRMKNQMPDERKIEFADHIILNDGEHSVVSQVLILHKELISLSMG